MRLVGVDFNVASNRSKSRKAICSTASEACQHTRILGSETLDLAYFDGIGLGDRVTKGHLTVTRHGHLAVASNTHDGRGSESGWTSKDLLDHLESIGDDIHRLRSVRGIQLDAIHYLLGQGVDESVDSVHEAVWGG